jgi:hypothetical protein
MLQAKSEVVIFLLIACVPSGQPKPVVNSRAPSYQSQNHDAVSCHNYTCPMTEGLEEVASCSYPTRRGRGKTLCTIEHSIMPNEDYCLTKDDSKGDICCKEVTDEGSRSITCRCQFDPENLDPRYCHLYKYNNSWHGSWTAARFMSWATNHKSLTSSPFLHELCVCILWMYSYGTVVLLIIISMNVNCFLAQL